MTNKSKSKSCNLLYPFGLNEVLASQQSGIMPQHHSLKHRPRAMQASLFDQQAIGSEPIRHDLQQLLPHEQSARAEPSGSLVEYPAALLANTADQLFATLLKVIPWRQETLRIAGRTLPVPRLQCWMGDANSVYGYSGMRLEPEPWQEDVQRIRALVERLAGQSFNSVLLNLYRDGQDSVAWHADDEAELGPAPVIASVSLGAERRFQLKPKVATPRSQCQILLKHGSVLVMDQHVQQHWLHQVPKDKTLSAPRINLTFRQILSPQQTSSAPGERAADD